MYLSSLRNRGYDIPPQGFKNSQTSRDSRFHCGIEVESDMAIGNLAEPFQSETVDNNPGKNSWQYPSGAPSHILDYMKYESNRLKSFNSHWPLPYIKPEDLAAVGLFYLGLIDKVQCAFCRLIISEWEEGDQPLQEHSRHNPLCPFLLNCNVGNVPISGSNGKQHWQIRSSHAECGQSSEPVNSQLSSTERLNVKYPTMESCHERLKSLILWPLREVVSAVKLAEAGFFYRDVSDVVTCFCCGESLANWTVGDDPWLEHAKHFPYCAFLRVTKGQEFIESARSNARASCNEGQSSNASECQSSGSSQQEQCTSGEPEVATSQESEEMKPPEQSNEAPGENESSTTSQAVTRICKICMEEGNRAVFVPCGHSLTCLKCASKLSLCPFCRTKISSAIRLFSD